MVVVRMIASLVSALLVLLEFAMFLRAILSWIPTLGNSAVGDFVCTVTEPLIAPIRALADRFGWFRNSPIDFSFMIAYLLLFLLQRLVETFSIMYL